MLPALNRKEDAFGWLETGWQERAAWMPFLKVDSRMDTLRTDRRFSELMGRINYPQIPAH